MGSTFNGPLYKSSKKGKIMKRLLSTTVLLSMFSTVVFAEDTAIEMLNKRDDGAKMVYSEDVTRIDVGDTITWLPTSCLLYTSDAADE